MVFCLNHKSPEGTDAFPSRLRYYALLVESGSKGVVEANVTEQNGSRPALLSPTHCFFKLASFLNSRAK